MERISDVTVKCGDQFGPNVTGEPNVTGIRGKKHSLFYEDRITGECGISRIWTAIDEAGNIGKINQTFYFTNHRAPEVKCNPFFTERFGTHTLYQEGGGSPPDPLISQKPCYEILYGIRDIA